MLVLIWIAMVSIGLVIGATAGYGIGFVLGVVVWIDEVVFIKTNKTRMTQITRIRADLGF